MIRLDLINTEFQLFFLDLICQFTILINLQFFSKIPNMLRDEIGVGFSRVTLNVTVNEGTTRIYTFMHQVECVTS